MRIGILSQWFAPETGPASIPGVLARELANRGHEVRVLTGYPNYPTGQLYEGYRIHVRESSWQDGFGVRRVALYPDHSHRMSGRILNYASFSISSSVWGVSALKNVDVIWVYNSPATVALPMWLAKSRYNVPVVLHNMDMWPDSLLSTGFAPSRGINLVMNILDRWVSSMYRSSAFVAALSPEAGEELVRRGVPQARVRLAPTWIDESVFYPSDGERMRERLGYPSRDLIVGYAGALGRAQGVASLARAIAALPPEISMRLVVLGTGTQEEEIRDLAIANPQRVSFLGHVSHTEVGDYIAMFDYAYVGLSSAANNAWAAPSKIPSLFACGKPILGCLVGDSASLVQGSGAGVVVPPEDEGAMNAVLVGLGQAGRSEALRLGRVAREFYEREMSAAVCIDRVEQILRDAVEGRAG